MISSREVCFQTQYDYRITTAARICNMGYTKERANYICVTTIWAGGLALIAVLAILCVGVLGFGVFNYWHVRQQKDAPNYVGVCIVIFVVLALMLRKVFNGFYEWHSNQQLKAVSKDIDDTIETQKLKQYVSDFSSYLPEGLLNQLHSSPTFRATALEADKLIQEAAVFERTAHTDAEKEAFRKAFNAKVGEFSERVAQSDPLAVEVVMKAVEMESQKGG